MSLYASGEIASDNASDLTVAAQINPNLFSSFSNAYITCLDSGYQKLGDSPTLNMIVETNRLHFRRLGDGIVVTADDYVFLARNTHLLSGFDEVWFSNIPFILPYSPEFIRIRWTEINEESSEGLRRWLESSKVVLGVGDGIGLRYITCDAGIEDQIGKIFLGE